MNNNNVLIVGIDPANVQTAVIVESVKENKIILKGIFPNEELGSVISEVNRLAIDREAKVHIGIEMIASYGMAVGATVFETCVTIGRLLQICEDYFGQTPQRIFRKDVKMCLCHTMKAKDANIRQALIDIYGIPGTKKNPNPYYNDSEERMSKDLWAALGVLHYYKTEILK